MTFALPARCRRLQVASAILSIVAVQFFFGSQNSIGAPLAAPGDPAPTLQIRDSGPLSPVNALVFRPNGSTLFAGGHDKIVQVWQRTRRNEGIATFEPSPDQAIHVPIGSGADGTIEAMTVSSDSRWLAVGGRGAKRNLAGERDLAAYVTPAASMTTEMWLDEGAISVFDTHTQTRPARLLRGHAGAIVALQFVPQSALGSPLLVSAAYVPKAPGQIFLELALWDVVQEKQLASMRQLPYATADGVRWESLYLRDPAFQNKVRPTLPWLAPWMSGDDTASLQVAFGVWHSQCGLRIWTPRTKQVTLQQTGESTLPVTGCRDPQHPGVIWTAHYNEATATGSLVSWDLRDQATKGIQKGREFHIPQPNHVPIALTTFQSDRQYAACVTFDFSKGLAASYAHALRVLDLDQGNWVSRPIWNDRWSIAYLAASPDGQIAIARNDRSQVDLIDLKSIQQGSTVSQTLHGQGKRFRSVAFAHKNAELGLYLGSEPRTAWGAALRNWQSQGVLFDAGNRQVVRDPAGWAIDQNPEGEFSVAVKGNGSNNLIASVERNGESARDIAMRCDDSGINPTSLTSFVICPKSELLPVPLLIAALECDRQPFLYAYNLETGERVREFSGHRGRIDDLALSSDGRFLASVAADRTVRIWALDKWKQHLGLRGMLRDKESLLAVKDVGGTIAVVQDFGDLRKTDVILRAEVEGQAKPIKSAQSLYLLVNKLIPASKITLVTNRGPVVLNVGQAIDHRKALCALYCLSGEKEQADALHWICWHPLGPFDSSGTLAEGHLGWHFNTGDPMFPVRFAAASEYREAYYTPGLLKALLETGMLPQRPLPALPRLSLLFEREQGKFLDPDERGEFVIRDPRNLKHIHVHANGGSSLLKIKSARWSIDGDPKAAATQEAPSSGLSEWTITPPPIEAQRGRFRFQVRLTTDEQPPRVVAAEALLRVQRVPPEIRFHEPIPAQVDGGHPTFPIEVITHGERTRIRVAVLDNIRNVRFEKTIESDQPKIKIDPALELQPGYNRVEWQAVAVSALPDYEQLETAVEARNVTWLAKQAPLTITLDRVVAGKQSLSLATTAQPIRATAASAQIFGTIEAGSPLKTAAFSVDAKPQQPLADFKPGLNKLQFTQVLALEPGRHVVAFHVETEAGQKSDTKAAKVLIDYCPPLPEIAAWDVRPSDAAAARGGNEVVVVARRGHPPEVRVDADVENLGEDRGAGYTIVALLDGAEQAATRRAYEHPNRHEHWQTTLSLPPGSHKIQLKLANACGDPFATTEVVARSVRLPVILPTDGLPKQIDGTVLPKLSAVIDSATGPPSLKVRLNGKTIDLSAQVKKGEGETWTALIENIPLEEGKNRIELIARNSDGESVEPVVRELSARGRELVREIALVDPSPEQMLGSIELDKLAFNVRTDRPIEKLTVLVNDTPVDVSSRLLASKAGEQTRITVPVDREKIGLRYGPNNRIVAKVQDSDGAWPATEWTVSCPVAPVILRIDGLKAPDGREIKLSIRSDDGSIRAAEKCPQSFAVLHGHVEFASRQAAEAETIWLQVWVNGFLQEVVEASKGGATGPLGRPFESPIILNRKEHNVIEVRVQAGRPMDDSVARNAIVVDCEQPNAAQQLDLVIVAPRDSGLTAEGVSVVENRILDAIAARPVDANNPEAGRTSRETAFRLIKSHRRTGKTAAMGYVQSELDKISTQWRIQRRTWQKGQHVPEDQPLNGVVMMYYVGKERQIVGSDGHRQFVLLTSGSTRRRDPVSVTDDDMTSDKLSEAMSRLHGAHLLFLDVQPIGNQQVSNWPTDPHLGVFRTVWKSGPNSTASESVLLTAFEQAEKTRPPVLKDLELRIRTALQLPEFEGLVADLHVPDVLAEMRLVP